MHHQRIGRMEGFDVIMGTQRSQAATMALPPGESTGGSRNRHSNSDQYIFVLNGNGHALVGNAEVPLQAGSLLLIEAGETHEIVNDGTTALETINVYSAPAY